MGTFLDAPVQILMGTNVRGAFIVAKLSRQKFKLFIMNRYM